MNEVLDLVRKEFHVAYSSFDETVGSYVNMTEDVAHERFEKFMGISSRISGVQRDIKQSFVAIGGYLSMIRREELYRAVAVGGVVGYSNFYKFCADVYGFKKSTVANLLKVFDEFCYQDTGDLAPEYMNFSYTQLVELASMEKYRERIPETMSKRDIHKLKNYYKDNPPHEGVSVETDLQKCNELLAEENRKKNEEKNRINFVPAKLPEINSEQIDIEEVFDVQPVGHQSDELTSSEDERDLSTPDVQREVSFADIRNGLLRQLELLKKCSEWKNAAEIFESALKSFEPNLVVSKYLLEEVCVDRDVAKSWVDILRSQTAVQLGKPASGKLNLKNGKARKEWIDNYEQWGVWLEVSELQMKYYRYDFDNGSSLIVTTGNYYYYGKKEPFIGKRYCIIDKAQPIFDYQGVAFTNVVDWLTKHAKEI